MSTSLKTAAMAAGLLLGATAANAAVMTGRIERIYPQHHTIVLDKHVFRMSSPAFHSARLHRGETVRVTYHWTHGHRWATAVKQA